VANLHDQQLLAGVVKLGPHHFDLQTKTLHLPLNKEGAYVPRKSMEVNDPVKNILRITTFSEY